MGCCYSTEESRTSSNHESTSSGGARRDRSQKSLDFTSVRIHGVNVAVQQRVYDCDDPRFIGNFIGNEVLRETDRVTQREVQRWNEPESTTSNRNFDRRNNVQDLSKTVTLKEVHERKDFEIPYSGTLKLWDEVKVLSEKEKVSYNVAQAFITLLNEGCTLPFIARYRKYAVNYMMPYQLEELFDSYKKIIHLKKKVKLAIETLKKTSKLTPDVERRLLNARSLAELDLVYGPLKSQTLNLAERARNLGFERHAIRALNGENIDLKSLCGTNEEVSNTGKVAAHITHLVAEIIHTDTRVIERIKYLKEVSEFTVQSMRRISTETNENTNINSKSNPESYKLYFEWKCPSKKVKPHQTLALNRGEDAKILTVKVVVPEKFYQQLERYCLSLWKGSDWVKRGLQDAYNRLIRPWLSRQVRSDLDSVAYKESVDIFTANLEKFLLTEPIKNRNIAGLDPGFRHGCKVGLINCNGKHLDVRTLYPDLKLQKIHDPAAIQLKALLRKHNIEIIGLGNGTACRETEMWLKNYSISDNYPVIIVPEQGASIYSVSKEAQKEHPNMDPNHISALSIARRVLDPLGELIKVDPKSLGIGLYQHDVPSKLLESAIDSTVEKIVSLIGVDVNTASLAMLRRISGLNETLAKEILAYRNEKGNFTCRTEILKVNGIDQFTYQQCIGFLKVLGAKEPLDSTIIHPESYPIAKLFAKTIGVNIQNITQPHFPELLEIKTSGLNIKSMSQKLGTDTSTLELIIHAFKQKNYEDNVISFCRPVYSVTVQAIEEVREGMTLTGVVRNVVPFGCFVDCGVGDDGLIHRSKLNGNRTPKLGERVSVTVIRSVKSNKIQFKLEAILD